MSVPRGNKKLHILLTLFIVSTMFFILGISIIVVDSIGYLSLSLYCFILILHSISDYVISWFEHAIVSLNMLHSTSYCCCFDFELAFYIVVVGIDLSK